MPRPPSLSVELLRTLVALVRNGGDATVTARELRINQPSMSKRLRVFQHPGGMLPRPWVERHGHTWKLTADGERSFPAVQEIIRRYRQLLSDPAAAPAGPLVALGCGQTAVGGHVRAALAGFRKDHPGVRVRIRTLRSRQRIEELVAGGLDLAEVSQDEPTIRQIARRPVVVWPLTSEPLVLVAGTKSPWGAALAKLPEDSAVKPKPLAKLAAPMLVPEAGAAPRRGFDRTMARAGVLDGLNIELETGGWGVLVAYARDGHGIAVVSKVALESEKPGLVIRELDPASFPPAETRLVARRKVASREDPDLSAEGEAFRLALLAAVASG